MSAPLEEIRDELRSCANPAQAKILQRFFKTGPGEYGEGDVFLGVRVPALRKIARKCRGIPLPEIGILLKSGVHEERFLALVCLVQEFRISNDAGKRKIYGFYMNNAHCINNWDLVDVSAPHIIGAFLKDRSRAPLYKLAKSKSLWERRMAVVATFFYIRNNDFDETFRISKILVTDREDLIHKAVGWMLREAGKRYRPGLESFLKEHYLMMPRVMLRYAIERFPFEERRKYLHGEF